jgi:magnesium-transporting ATPase (P-type)
MYIHKQVLLLQRDSKTIRLSGLTKSPSQPISSSNIEKMNLLAVNEFDSDRKRMSVLVRCESENGENRHLLLCKGADSSTLPRCTAKSRSPFCASQIDSFANTGLRTLVFARKELTPEESRIWLKSYEIASSSINHRSEMLARCADEIERDMELLGAVGIEDQLQEGVPEAIDMLQKMGLNVW